MIGSCAALKIAKEKLLVYTLVFTDIYTIYIDTHACIINMVYLYDSYK